MKLLDPETGNFPARPFLFPRRGGVAAGFRIGFAMGVLLGAFSHFAVAQKPPSAPSAPNAPDAPRPFAVGKGTSIFVDPSEASWVQHAARDLQTDIRELTDCLAPLIDRLDEATEDLVAIGTRGTPWVEELVARGLFDENDFDGHESSVLRTLPDPWNLPNARSVLFILGHDARGTQFGVYTFTEDHLGTDPLKFWTGRRPAPLESKTLDLHRRIPTPTFPLRGFFINDEDLLSGWTGDRDEIGIEVYREIFETMARLKFNMAITRTSGRPEAHENPLAVERGFQITHHHAQYLGAQVWEQWDKFFASEGVVYSFPKYREAFEKFWAHSIDQWKQYPGVIWQTGFRGKGDRPFWHIDDPNAPADPRERGKIIEEAIKTQMRLARERIDPPPEFFTLTMWMEMNDLYKEGHFVIPEDVRVIWCDNGMGVMKSIWKDHVALPEKPAGGKHGVYYHVDLQDGWYNQMAQTVPPERIREEFCRKGGIIDMECTAYMMLNVGDIRPTIMGTKAAAELAWDATPWLENPDYAEVFYDRWCEFHFGKKAAPMAKRAYKALFDSPWIHGTHSYERVGMQGLMNAGRHLIKFRHSDIPWWSNYYRRRDTADHVAFFKERCASAFEDWNQAVGFCEYALPHIPEAKRQFFLDDVALQIDISRSANRFLYELSLAVEHDRARRYAEAWNHADAALAALDAIMDRQKQAEWGKWKNFYANDIIAGTPATRTETLRYRNRILFPLRAGFEQARTLIDFPVGVPARDAQRLVEGFGEPERDARARLFRPLVQNTATLRLPALPGKKAVLEIALVLREPAVGRVLYNGIEIGTFDAGTPGRRTALWEVPATANGQDTATVVVEVTAPAVAANAVGIQSVAVLHDRKDMPPPATWQPHAGRYALCLERVPSLSGDTGLDLYTNPLAVKPGHELELTLWLRNGDPGRNARVIVEFVDKPIVTTTNEWKPYRFKATVPTGQNTLNVGIRLDVMPGGSVLIDNVSVRDLTDGGRLLQVPNPSFENWTRGTPPMPTGWRFFEAGGARGSVFQVGNRPTQN